MLETERQVTTVPTYEMRISIDVPVAVFCMIAEILASAVYIYALSKQKVNSTILTGYAPSNKEFAMANRGLFLGYTRILMAILSLLFLIFEILIIVRGRWFTTIKNRMIRGVMYLLKGIAALGCVGDFGIAAGSFEIIAAAVLIVVEAIAIFNARGNKTSSDGFRAAE